MIWMIRVMTAKIWAMQECTVPWSQCNSPWEFQVPHRGLRFYIRVRIPKWFQYNTAPVNSFEDDGPLWMHTFEIFKCKLWGREEAKKVEEGRWVAVAVAVARWVGHLIRDDEEGHGKEIKTQKIIWIEISGGWQDGRLGFCFSFFFSIYFLLFFEVPWTKIWQKLKKEIKHDLS